MDCYRDEIFGPVLGVVRVDTYAEALALVNDNPYGNGTAIFTRDGGAARQFQFDCNVGMVGINVPDPGAGRLLLLRRLEGLALRRHPHVRPGGHPLLHPGQGRHRALARSGHVERGPGLPPHEVASALGLRAVPGPWRARRLPAATFRWPDLPACRVPCAFFVHGRCALSEVAKAKLTRGLRPLRPPDHAQPGQS